MSTDHWSWYNGKLTVGVVVDEVKARLVVHGSEVGLSDGKTNSACNTLTKRAGSDLNT